jgi:hypothetical protein
MKNLKKIVNSTEKVDILINIIAAASSEQARNIKHINDAVALMNRITQQNAANSAESAGVARSAAEVWADVVPTGNGGVSILPAVSDESAVSTAPAALSVHKRRQRRRRRMEAYRAERAYKHKRRLRAAAHNSVKTDRRKHRRSVGSARAVQAKELLELKENRCK